MSAANTNSVSESFLGSSTLSVPMRDMNLVNSPDTAHQPAPFVGGVMHSVHMPTEVLVSENIVMAQQQLQRLLAQANMLLKQQAPLAQQQEMGVQIDAANQILERQKKSLVLLTPGHDLPDCEYKIVPREIPFFQLEDDIRMKNREAFHSVNDFLVKFEVVLLQHNLNLDKNWERCILDCFPSTQLSWFRQEVYDKGHTWEQAKVILQEKYGVNDKTSYLLSKLHKMKLKRGQNPLRYLDEFQKAMRVVNVADNVILGNILVDSLTKNKVLQRAVRIAHAATPIPRPELNVARVCQLVPSVYQAIDPEDCDSSDEEQQKTKKQKECRIKSALSKNNNNRV
ncbi:hypothetical protein DFQ28_002276 [Apophysomyces sp. BC1034]|nr:hypothetical protein DFQ28_002276 [Apophysomyces sp. BC1034]